MIISSKVLGGYRNGRTKSAATNKRKKIKI